MNRRDFNNIAAIFGIEPEMIVYFSSGICYSMIGVRSEAVANKVSQKVREEGRCVNGGMLDGMPLGAVTYNEDDDDRFMWEVTC